MENYHHRCSVACCGLYDVCPNPVVADGSWATQSIRYGPTASHINKREILGSNRDFRSSAFLPALS